MKTKAFSTELFILLLTFQVVLSQDLQNSINSNLFASHVYARENGLPIDKVSLKI